MSKKTVNEMFLTAKEKSANDFRLGKEMIDLTDGMLGRSHSRIRRINENWNLHSGKWPELEEYLNQDTVVFRDEDGEGQPFNPNDFIVHHPKLNNVTNFILGGIIAQPIIPIIKDFSAYGRKFRQEERLKKAKGHYYENMLAPQEEMIRSNYYTKAGISDPMALNPDEQRQVESDLQALYKSQIPRSLLDDMKKIKTPDEKIRQTLFDYDMKAYKIKDKLILGGEQAVVAYEEYYKIGKKGVKPTFDVLNSKWVRWSGDEHCDFSEDGDMAAYDQYLTPHSFIAKHGREVIKKPNFMKDIQKYFTEVPGYFREGTHGKKADNTPMFLDGERDFVDMIGENPGLIQNNWRTIAGQQEIAGLYGALSAHHTGGRGIREVYTVFRWTEQITYVQRVEKNSQNKEVVNEYFFSADYKRDKTKDKLVRTFPISRVYHGTKVADRFYVGIEPVSWQFFGGIQDFEPKLTICGRRYAKSNGNDEDTTLMGPAIQYQLRYDITASKMEDLEKNDIGKIAFWNTEMKPDKWTDNEYMAMMMKFRNVPYTTTQTAQTGDNKPAFVIDQGSNAQMDKYSASLDRWENEMYKACRVNRDAIGEASPYQSNAQTQSNIQGASKQLLPFHNKRRELKERVLNYFSNLSMLCLLEDHEKQELLLDDFSRMHLQINADDIKAHNTSIFIVDDFAQEQKTSQIQSQILTMLQNPGTSVLDVIDIMDADSVPVMREIAQVSEIKTKESAADAHQQRMAELQEQNKGLLAAEQLRADQKKAIEERKQQVNLMLADIEATVLENAADVDDDNNPDSIDRVKLEIASKEKIAKEKNETDLLRENIKAKMKSKPIS